MDMVLRRHYAAMLGLFVVAWCVLTLQVEKLLLTEQHWVLILSSLLFGVMVLELLLRGVMWSIYGSKYVYSILNYTLVDHPVYGNCFRRSTKTHEVGHLLFDKFVLYPDSPRSLDLDQNKANRVNFSINSLGYRGVEFTAQKKARLRIFCVGGSTTACDCNDDEDAWPSQLQSTLIKKGYDVEVINAGVQGWYSYQDYLRIRDEIRNYDADIILLQQGWNEEFEFSSLSLGKNWQPCLVRNVREQHHLCCPPNRFLSNARLLSVYMGVHAFMKRVFFLRNMSFENPARWMVLKQAAYISAWFENMILSAHLAADRGIMFYNVNFPSLVDVNDTVEEREIYVNNSRLSELFANYQAISKRRFTRTLQLLRPVLPCLDIDVGLQERKAVDRLSLFDDEMHTTPRGNALIGSYLASLLLADDDFHRRYDDPANRVANVNLDPNMISEIHSKVIYNEPGLDRKIDEILNSLNRQ
jgi:hypothetical protein